LVSISFTTEDKMYFFNLLSVHHTVVGSALSVFSFETNEARGIQSWRGLSITVPVRKMWPILRNVRDAVSDADDNWTKWIESTYYLLSELVAGHGRRLRITCKWNSARGKRGDSSLHLLVLSMKKLNQTEPAAFSILPFWSLFKDSIFLLVSMLVMIWDISEICW
jgi:hypothetical protein